MKRPSQFDAFDFCGPRHLTSVDWPRSMKGEKPSEFEVFDFCGPRHLTTVDWSKPDERKSVGASLVQGVYVLEGDRHKKRTGKEQLAPKWWEFFQFECIQTLKDKYDHSIFGAIFEYKPKKPSTSSSRSTPSQDNNNNNTPPKYVIALRGTIMKHKTWARDLYLDAKIGLHLLGNSSRYQFALDAVQGILIKQENPKDIWLAGHSLGAAIALQTGRAMAKMGTNIETYLFNPPFPSAPIERLLKHRHLKHGARIAKSFITAGLSLALKIKHRKDNSSSHDDDDDDNNNDPFATLRSWIPWMFVNPKDIICCEYAGYFEHREKMKSWGIGEIEKIAAKNSIMNLLMGVLGSDSEASYLIPSAFVSVNMKNMIVKEDGLLLAHGLSQWWEQHSCWQSKLYQ